jgi:formylglycine-generating enzyme required for sulfatase activity
MPPPGNSGNYADETAAGMLPIIVREYSDGYLFAAPVGQFPANKAQIYDLAGNIAEWTHDYYDVYTGGADQVLRDPTGPETGDLHVVRGASWRHGSITELRLSYRDYALKPRNDLGFRIARYATRPSK